ncbi:MAG: DUF4350 domain-containing protein [Chloroflexota bacterium]|nr:MAG: hypothetical protein DLM70_19595 [Chloroflexota bacterium]
MIWLYRRLGSWFWLVTAVGIVVVMQVAAASKPARDTTLNTQSGGPGGALAAYLWLDRIGYHVRRVTDGSLGLSTLTSRRSTLMLLDQGVTLTGEQTRRVLSWVHKGGRFILAIDGTKGGPMIDALRIDIVPLLGESLTVTQPLLAAPPVASLAGSADAGMSVPGSTSAVEAAGAAVLAHARRGLGEIWVLSAPAVLDNVLITHADNRALLLNLAGPSGRTVVFDEYVPAATPASGAGWFTGSSWGVALLYVTVILVLYRWLSGWRLGLAEIPLTDRHRPLTEYVLSVGGLLRRAGKRGDVLRLYQENLRCSMRERFGVELEDLTPEARQHLDSLLSGGDRLSESKMVRRVNDIVEYEEEIRRTHV